MNAPAWGNGMKHRARKRHVPEINLVPMLDMMALLIQVLLINVHFGAYAQIETKAGGKQGQDPTSGQQVVVGVQEDGFTVSWSAAGTRMQRGFPCPSTPCAPSDYNAVALRTLLEALKETAPDETRVVLSPHGAIPFEVMALAMDTVRTDSTNAPLFPDIVVADER